MPKFQGIHVLKVFKLQSNRESRKCIKRMYAILNVFQIFVLLDNIEFVLKVY